MWHVNLTHPDWTRELWEGEDGASALVVASMATKLFRIDNTRVAIEVLVGDDWTEVAPIVAGA